MHWNKSWRYETAHELARHDYSNLNQATDEVAKQFAEWGLLTGKLNFKRLWQEQPEQDSLFPDFKDKYTYVKMLRAQLISSEQLLIYYNAQAWFNIEWHSFLTRYRLIKNISHGLADFDIPPLARFADDIVRLRAEGIEMFENYN